MSSSVPFANEVVDDVRNRWIKEINMINQRFFAVSEQIILLKRLRVLVNPCTSSLIKSAVKVKKCGKNFAINEASICRLPMAHELIASSHDSYSDISSQYIMLVSSKSIKRPKKNV